MSDSFPCGLMVTDITSRRVSYANIYLYKLIGRQPSDDPIEVLEQIFTKASLIFTDSYLYPMLLSEGKCDERLLTIRHVNGDRIPVVVNLEVKGENQAAWCIMPAVERNTLYQELLTAREVLETQLERQRQMFAVIGHELRTPVASLNMLLGQTPESGCTEQDKTQLRQISEHCLRVLDDLRFVVDPNQAKTVDIKAQPVSDVVRSVVHSLSPLLAEFKQHCNVRVDGLHRRVKHNSKAVRQIVTNLIKNAVLHSGATQIGVEGFCEVKENLAEITVCVSDDGCGVDSELQDKIWEAFSRGETDSDGTGLGLYISSELAKQIGGTLEYKEAVEGGSRFTLSFDAEVCDDVVPAPVETQTDLSVISNKRILLAEDNETIRLITEKILTAAGALVTSACDGKSALQCYVEDRQKFDLIFTDIMMPEMNGYELTTALRLDGCKLPILGITAATIGEEQKRLLEAGADRVLSKPISLKALYDVLPME